MKLFIHMRLLKGAKALDTEWMGVDPGHVWSSVWLPVATAIDSVLENVKFDAGNPAWCQQRAEEWSLTQLRKYGANPCKGLIGAVDGIIIKIPHLLAEELREIDMPWVRFWNRKGYHALNAQAVCDAYCRFTSFECRWPGSTNDITAYRQSALFLDQMHLLPPEFFLALDEAYKSVKDGQHLTPFSGADIDAANNQHLLSAAAAMRLFNKIFCLDRITIERAFGQLVRRWGVLWSALPRVRLQQIALLLRVCIKLHNLCVDEWLSEKYGFASEDGRSGRAYPHPQTPGSVAQELAGHRRAGDQPALPEERDVAQLNLHSLLNATDRLSLRVNHAEDVDLDIPQAPFSTTDATLNAGIAMSNWLDEEQSTRATNRSVAEVAAAVQATEGHHDVERAEDQQEGALHALADRDASAARRLRITLQMQALGLAVVDV